MAFRCIGTIQPEINSEIGIFSQSGLLVGSGVYLGKNTAITVWGNDELNSEIDGLFENEQFMIKIWNDNSETFLKVENWQQGDEFYQTNKIAIADKLSTFNFQFSTLKLFQNIPNPFQNQTTINYYLPEDSEIELSVYNILGEKIKVLESCKKASGDHSFIFDTKKLASGTYYYKLEVGGEGITKRMSILK